MNEMRIEQPVIVSSQGLSFAWSLPLVPLAVVEAAVVQLSEAAAGLWLLLFAASSVQSAASSVLDPLPCL
jgi:hypothetical protein